MEEGRRVFFFLFFGRNFLRLKLAHTSGPPRSPPPGTMCPGWLRVWGKRACVRAVMTVFIVHGTVARYLRTVQNGRGMGGPAPAFGPPGGRRGGAGRGGPGAGGGGAVGGPGPGGTRVLRLRPEDAEVAVPGDVPGGGRAVPPFLGTIAAFHPTIFHFVLSSLPLPLFLWLLWLAHRNGGHSGRTPSTPQTKPIFLSF